MLGVSAVSDSCNTIELTRKEWQEVAENAGADFVNIEIQCSDPKEHEHRVTTRMATGLNLNLPSWHQVQTRYYEPWVGNIVRVDTAGKTVEESFSELIKKLSV